jgi:hypothetical protein
MKKLLALATTLTLLVTFTIPVLADDNTSNSNTSQAPISQSSPTDKATKAKERLQNEKAKTQIQQQFQQYMGPVRDLQKQEVQIREQIRSTRSQIRQQVKSDKQAKNYTALSAALSHMIVMQDDITGVTNATKTCLTDWQQYYTDRQAKNVDGITADLKNLQRDIPTKISAMQKVLEDLQQISNDLDIPATTTTTTPTPTTTPLTT